MSAEIIQFIPRPKRDDTQTDFPTIAFRSASPDPAVDPVAAAPTSMPDRSSEKPSVAKALVEIRLSHAAIPGPRSAFSSASCDARTQPPPPAFRPPTPFSIAAGARPHNRWRTAVKERSN